MKQYTKMRRANNSESNMIKHLRLKVDIYHDLIKKHINDSPLMRPDENKEFLQQSALCKVDVKQKATSLSNTFMTN